MKIKASTASIIIIGFIVAIFFSFIAIAAIDTPHNASNNISCGSCHGAALLNSPFWGGSYSPANIDDTVYNKLCLNCHRTSSGPYTDTNAPLVKTHSSLSTSNKYGDWTRECRTCHDPHYQKQKNYKNTESGNLYLATGTITSGVYNGDGTSTLTYSTITYKSGWYPPPEDDPNKKYLTKKTSDYRRTVLFPNVGKLGYNYPIIAVDTPTAGTITVTGNATAYLYPPTTFAVLYGQYVKDTMNVSGTDKAVKFFDQTGAKSYADGDGTYDGVCEVCHTQTQHFRNAAGAPDQNHGNLGGVAGTNCISCHPHLESFKASCNACHGFPPPSLASIPLPTGSTTAGAHVLHVTTKSYQCSICHYNSAGSGATHNNNIITLGFVSLLGAYTGGSYDGQTSANYQSSDAGTTVSKTGNKQCSNIYCHGGTMAPNGGTASAVWDNPLSAACGTCHGASTGAPPTRGSHSKHTGSAGGGRQLECTVCHSSYTSAHINGSVKWAYDTTTYTWLSGALYKDSTSGSATPVPSTSYGTCSNLYCHSQGTSNASPYPAPNITAIWGVALDATCTGCHSGDKNAVNKMGTGSHTKHVIDSSLDCTKCHNQTASDSRTIINQANHVNNFVNVAYDSASNPGGNATYNSLTSPMTKTPGTAYSQCSNIYCHGSGTPTWGSGIAIVCDGCHKASNVLQGKHGAHYASATVATNRTAANNSSDTTYIFNCGVCHDPGATTHGGGAVSGIQAAQVVFDTTVAGGGTYTAGTLAGTDNGFNWSAGTCITTYCHSPGTKFLSPYDAPNNTTFNWNSAAGTLVCNGCHGNPPDYTNGSPKTNSHSAHSDYSCNICHLNTTSTGSAITNKANHINKAYNTNAGAGESFIYTYNVAGGTCTNISCHGCNNATWGATLTCLDCHSGSCGSLSSRADITSQFSANSHHIQGVTVIGTYCYKCHWEANSDGIINHTYHGGPKVPNSAVDLVIYGAGTRPAEHTSGITAIEYTANGTRAQIKNINSHCLGCHSTQNNSSTPFGDGKTPKQYAWDGTSINEKYSQTGTTTWGKYGQGIDIPVTNESFENNPGYDETGWTETIGAGCTLDPDSIIPNPQTEPDFGAQCLKSVSPSAPENTEYKAFAKLDYGLELAKTLTSFYLYVEDIGLLPDGNKVIGGLRDRAGNNVFVFRLYKTAGGQLQFKLRRVWNNGSSFTDYPVDISLSAWYKINIEYDTINETWEWQVYDGATKLTENSGSLTGTTYYKGIQKWFFGFMRPATDTITGTIYFDLISAVGQNLGDFTPKTIQTKAYSAHGNAINNQGGWKDSWVDQNETWPDNRNGSENIACFDCHNSHGSNTLGVTTSYASATTNGGILKDIHAGDGGYSVTYKPQAGGATANKNAYNAGAGLCFDCHMNADAGTTPTPWGYQSTFEDTQKIMGYRDTPYFGSGTSGPQQRFPYKSLEPPYMQRSKGGHFGASSDLSGLPGYPPPDKTTINGLCTPCHDPHGVSPSLGTNMQYGVPLLKGTWLTSLYKEDRAPANDAAGTLRTDRNKEGVQYHIDQNTFGSNIMDTGTGIHETDTKFAGLCLNCHTKNSLTNGTNGGTWKTIDRIHESVKGWGANVKHNYPCSKCHAPHNSRLPRLMVTNCLDKRHKGRMENNPSPIIQGSGNGYVSRPLQGCIICNGESEELGYCPPECPPEGCFISTECNDPKYSKLQAHMGSFEGDGSGKFPGSWKGGWRSYSSPLWPQYANSVTCHEGKTSDQSWNTKTHWYNDTPVILDPPGITAGPFTLVGADIQVTITWTTDINSTSYVDYGVTPSYGSTTGNSMPVTSHSVILTGLTNHSTHHYRVRSAGALGTEKISEDNILDCVSFPPSIPSLIAEFDFITTNVTLDWNASTNPGNGGPVQYYAEIDDDPNIGSPNYTSGWISGTSWTIPGGLPSGYWSWRVKARDEDYTESESNWSSVDNFMNMARPPLPTLIPEPDTICPGPCPVTLGWNLITSWDGHPLEYFVQVDDVSDFSSPNYQSGWISGTSWEVEVATAKTWYWRVWKTRDAVHTFAESWGAFSYDSFVVMSSNPPPAPALIDEPDVVVPSEPASVTFEWNSVTDPDGDPVQYYVCVSQYSDLRLCNYNSGWITGNCVSNVCSWTASINLGTWYWGVQARDAAHTEAVSPYSTVDSFVILLEAPPAPTLIDEPDVVSTVPVAITLQWNAVTCPDGHTAQYYAEVDDAIDFSSPNYTTGWISGSCVSNVCNWSVTVDPDKTWYWRVKARDSYWLHQLYVSEWSTPDSFNVIPHNPPPAPTFWAEPDIITTQPTDVTLQWWAVTSPDGDPVEYYVEVDDDSAFSSPDYNSDWISGTNWTVTLPPGYWCWRVKARDNSHNISIVSAWSTSDCFNTRELPPAPVLIDEPNTVSLGQVAITLEWNSVTCPDGDPAEYYVQVDDSTIFLSPNYISGWISETTQCSGGICSWTVTVDPAIVRTWYWRVKARDAVHTTAESSWPTYDSFVIMSSNPPPAPTLIDESDVLTTIPVSITFEWNAVTDPDGDSVQYYVQVSQYPNFLVSSYTSGWISETTQCSGGICRWTVTVTNGIRWYWRVQARDAAHTDAVSPYSAVDTFTTFSSNPPPAPTLIDEQEDATNTPTLLEWNSVTDPDGDPVQYSVCVSTFSNLLFCSYTSGWISGTNWSVTISTARIWYWGVQARDVVHTDAVSLWSTPDSFNVYAPPPAPTLVDEPNIVSSGPVSVTLDWNSVTCPDGDPVQYYVEIDDASNFSSLNYTSGWITGTNWSVTLPTATTWYWRVAARDSVHTVATSPWSTADSFSIFTVNPPPAPTLIDEPDVSIPVPVDVTLEWNPVTCPDGDPVEYYVEVDDAIDFSSPNYTTGWILNVSWSVTLPTATTWYWRVQARDSVHTDATSSWSTFDSFVIYGPPSAPTLIDEPDTVSSGPLFVTLNWDAVTCPDGDSAEYYVEVDNASDFSSPDYTSGVTWLSGTSWSVDLPTATTWYWRVQARDAIHTDLRSSWSTDSFVIYTPFIDESFEGTGYEESWTETIDGGTLDEDSAIPGAPPSGAGSQCLKSVSSTANYKAFAIRNYGSMQTKTFTSFYLYVGAEGLADGDNKPIGALRTSDGSNVFVILLNQNAGQLRIRLRLFYNNGSSYLEDNFNISLNIWYKIEIKYDTTNPGAADAMEWRVDGVSQGGSALSGLTGGYYSGIQQWVCGFLGNQTFTGTVYFDLIRANTLTFY